MNSSMKWGLIAGAAIAVVAVVRAKQMHDRACEDAHQDDLLNDALEDSFPASDPPAHTPTTASAVGV